MKLFDTSKMRYYPLAERKNKVDVKRDFIDPENTDLPVSPELQKRVDIIAPEILRARDGGKSVILAFGAHTIKNGLGAVLGEFIARRWVSHLATNGAGLIHDWEFAFQGESSEDVRVNAGEGKFGAWDETGFYLNMAINAGAFEGLGYGESVGALIVNQGFNVPPRERLRDIIAAPFSGSGKTPLWKRGAAADFLEIVEALDLPSGWHPVQHAFPEYSVQAAAFRAGVPFTGHPMFGHDVIYTHRANRGPAIGRGAEKDFLAFVESVSNLEGGVYLSVGSAVMSPMIFEKSLSMARNVLRRENRDIRNCHIYVTDLQEASWDWSAGEPSMDNPAYYLRFMKTFNRMGCPLSYISADNRHFFLALYRALRKLDVRREKGG
ncbi:MAG: hypothetical protein LBG10_04090 [Treponema sp.]|jgi:hypothetical protein|nr:hypothetical protein [Treponema sp.]